MLQHAAKCAAIALRAYNEAIFRETGIENIACMVEKPTLDSFNAICKHEAVRLLLITGGPVVVKAAMPFVGVLMIFLIIVTYVTWLSTALPYALMGPELVIK